MREIVSMGLSTILTKTGPMTKAQWVFLGVWCGLCTGVGLAAWLISGGIAL